MFLPKYLIIGIMCLFSVSVICGCASLDDVHGTAISDSQMNAFVKGKTSKDDVVKALGGPQDIKIEGNKQILTYNYQKIGAISGNEAYNTIFIFDEKGILEESYKSNSPLVIPSGK